eukprot:5663279-Amphidinium_carterae.3
MQSLLLVISAVSASWHNSDPANVSRETETFALAKQSQESTDLVAAAWRDVQTTPLDVEAFRARVITAYCDEGISKKSSLQE